jgi:hypothetical protein
MAGEPLQKFCLIEMSHFLVKSHEPLQWGRLGIRLFPESKMSRFKKSAHSLMSCYAVLGANRLDNRRPRWRERILFTPLSECLLGRQSMERLE